MAPTTESVIHLHPAGTLLALLGNPNSGKTALFNRLTGSRQKVANYAGVTVERKEGRLPLPSGRTLRVLDLPGAYSLNPRSPDEQVTRDVLFGTARGEKRPDVLLCVVDATNLRRHLKLVLAALRLGMPCIVVLNMVDVAERRGMTVDAGLLARELGVPVVPTVATTGLGVEDLRALLDDPSRWRLPVDATAAPEATPAVAPAAPDVAGGVALATHAPPGRLPDPAQPDDHRRVQAILERLGLADAAPPGLSDRIDDVVLHPVVGPLLLAVVLFLIFQAVFAWATPAMDAIEALTGWLGARAAGVLPDGWIRSLVVDGLIAGVGGVFVFLPQILILFFFILVLEESGYLPRAAFLLDRLMGSLGLSGRSFIPLLSSFSCAIPGIMATRTLANRRDRYVTMALAPLMTCSARLPVYALLIGAFIPHRTVWGGVQLQGLVLFALYLAGIVGAALVAWILKVFTSRGAVRTLMMELPAYHWPRPASIALGLWQRVVIFVNRVGSIILGLTLLMWFLSSVPSPPPGATGAPIEYSLAGQIGRALAVVFEPIGFNWQISIALVPGLAAREVAVGALGTVYSLSATGEQAAEQLGTIISQHWSVATGLSLLAWYVFAPQCLSTLATIRRETGGWTMPVAVAAYLFALAYLASFVTYRVAVASGLG